MKNFKSLSEIDDYYQHWNKVVTSTGIRYVCPPKLGEGYVQLIGNINTAFISIVNYVEYHPFLLRSYMKEQLISIANVQSGSSQYYRNKQDTKTLDRGVHCSINAFPTLLYSKINDNSYLKSTGLVIREAFLQTLPLEQHDLEQMAYRLNNQPVYDNTLLLICKQLNHIPVADKFLPLYLESKAIEVISVLMTLTLKAKNKPKLTKDMMQNIKSAKTFLDSHYINPPKIDELASMFYINKNLLQSGFKNLTGHTVYEYITYQKINHSVELLLSTNMTVEVIAEQVGYKSKMNFYNAFKNLFLVTPAELRKNH